MHSCQPWKHNVNLVLTVSPRADKMLCHPQQGHSLYNILTDSYTCNAYITGRFYIKYSR